MINPLHAATPVIPQQPSPYFPSRHRYRNVLYVCVEEVLGAVEAGIELERLTVADRALNRERRIDRDAIFRLKMHALEHFWPEFGGDPAFDRYCHKQGTALQQFATFCALAEHTMAGDGRPGPPSIAAPMRRQWRGSLLNVPTASASISGYNGSSTCS